MHKALQGQAKIDTLVLICFRKHLGVQRKLEDVSVRCQPKSIIKKKSIPWGVPVVSYKWKVIGPNNEKPV